MKLYLDQMLNTFVAEALRREGHDVLRASETGHARADDGMILDNAKRENRVLVTLDEHFGNWVVLPLSRHPGVIRLKVNPTTARNILDVLIPFLRNIHSSGIANHLVIVSSKRAKWVKTWPEGDDG